MTTPPGWEPRPGPTRGDPARRAPRGSGGIARDDADPRRQPPRGGAPSPGRGYEAGPSFTPGRGPGQRDNGPGGPRGPRRPTDDFERRPRPASGGRPAEADRLDFGGPGSRPANGISALQSGGLTRWIGKLSTRTAILVLIAGSLLGVVFTLMAGQEPGTLLGFFIIMGSIAAALGIQRGKAYLLFPAPALAFFVTALLVGKVHDAKLGSSTAGLGAGFTQWVAGIFFPAVVATILVLLIGGGRWLLGRQLITGQSLLSSGGPARPSPPRGNARPTPSARRPARNDPARDDWADDDPFDGQQQAFQTQITPAVKDDRPAWTGSPGSGNPRPPRDRDQRTNRDPWGDPRPPADRNQPPGMGTGPRSHPNGQPRDRGPRPSFDPNERPRRPLRPQPPEDWNPR